ncbi:MAG TPA: homogentisate phytyltransferase [Thermoleophilaceae bacterium]|nr:homogentisate phytyltransferase [Thermoleophilaceae bacterium]
MGAAVRSLAVRAADRPLTALWVLWRFSRPHTLVATTTSILGIYVLAAAELPGMALGDGLGALALTLLAGALVNVYIVGLNQLEDIDIDRVNKPGLPIPAGDLSVRMGRTIVALSGAVAALLGLTQGWVELSAIGAAMAIGTAYSLPPLRLKRYPALAAASIAIVRAVVVNVGVYEHFAATLGNRPELSALPAPIVALTLFVLPFSFAIAVLKDVPDVKGDRRFGIATFSVRLGPRRALAIGLAALTAGYLGMALLGALLIAEANPWVFAGGHLLALAVLWRWALAGELDRHDALARFYMRVWLLFMLEYALVPAAVLAS